MERPRQALKFPNLKMRTVPKRLRRGTLELSFTLALGGLLALSAVAIAQDRGSPEREWRYQSGDAWGTRYSPLDQVDASRPQRPTNGRARSSEASNFRLPDCTA